MRRFRLLVINFRSKANCLQQHFAIAQKAPKNHVKMPETHTSYLVDPVNA
jgi:hypothetical protein